LAGGTAGVCAARDFVEVAAELSAVCTVWMRFGISEAGTSFFPT
jgi:hypothetical protein